jgi:hypothetical protein
MRDEVVAALVIVLVVASAGVGYFVGSSRQRTTTSVSTTTLTATAIKTTSTSCIQTGIHGSLYVRVVTDNTDRPVVGDNVTVTILDYCNNSEQRIPLGYTNSSGYTSSPADWTGDLLVNVTNVFSGASYMFLAQTSGAVSLATLSLPSGLTVIRPIACYSFGGTCSNTTTTFTAVG